MLGWPFKLKMRYKNRWVTLLGFFLTNFILLSPSLAQSFIQICPNGVQEVGGIDVVLVKLDAEERDKNTGSGFCIYWNEASIGKSQ